MRSIVDFLNCSVGKYTSRYDTVSYFSALLLLLLLLPIPLPLPLPLPLLPVTTTTATATATLSLALFSGRRELFANKFRLTYEYPVLDCLEQRHRDRTATRRPADDFDDEFYRRLPTVVYGRKDGLA